MITTGGGGFSLSALKPKWWPFEWNLQFLAMSFTGLRFTQNPHWLVAALWATLLLLVLLEFWRNRRDYKLNIWFPVLFCMSVAGYFVLPFSIVTDARYTFFNVRMAPIFFFLLVPIVVTIPIHRFAGRIVIILCLALTCYSASLHDKVAKEIDGYVPIFEKMEKKGAVLLLIGTSRSEYLDPFFYANYHYCFPFYYHVLKGGGINSDMFNTRLMPVGFKEERRPGRPPRRELQRWVEYIPNYDYVIVRQMPRAIHLQLEYYGEFLDTVGPWDLYKLKK
jgi:hypothetical protein